LQQKGVREQSGGRKIEWRHALLIFTVHASGGRRATLLTVRRPGLQCYCCTSATK